MDHKKLIPTNSEIKDRFWIDLQWSSVKDLQPGSFIEFTNGRRYIFEGKLLTLEWKEDVFTVEFETWEIAYEFQFFTAVKAIDRFLTIDMVTHDTRFRTIFNPRRVAHVYAYYRTKGMNDQQARAMLYGASI